MQNDQPQDNVGSEATLPRPGNHQPELNGIGPKAIVLIAMCVLAVVVLACFLWAKWQHPTRPLNTQWDTDTHRVTVTQPDTDNYLREVSSVAFSPDGKRIADGMIFSGGSGIEKEEHWARVWDAATGHQDLALKGQTRSVTSVAFSQDGKRIASGSWDKTVKVWDATNGKEILTFKGHPDMVTSVAFSPDGERIAIGGLADVTLWDTSGLAGGEQGKSASERASGGSRATPTATHWPPRPKPTKPGSIDPDATLRVVDEQGRDVPAFDVMARTADRGRSQWEHGMSGKATLQFLLGFGDVQRLDVVVRSPGEYASTIEHFTGDKRDKLFAGETTLVLHRGESVQLRFRLPAGMVWPTDVKPEVYFDDDRDFVGMMWQAVNRRHGFSEPNSLGVRGSGPGRFEFRLSSQSPPFDVAIQAPGFVQYFDRGPFTFADVKKGVLEIEVEKPAALTVHFDAGGRKPEVLPFQSSIVDVYRKFPRSPSSIFQVTFQNGSPMPRDLRVTDLAAGDYRIIARTEAKPREKPAKKFDPFAVDPGAFQDLKNVTLSAGQTKTVDLHYAPFDENAFRGQRTAIVRITKPDGKAVSGRDVTIGYFDGHYGTLPVFAGKVPPSGAIMLKNITAEKHGLSRGPYSVRLGSDQLGRFGFETKDAMETFTFIVPPVAGDEAPDIDLVNVATGKHSKLSEFRGQTVCLDFWATWCGPCQEPMRRLDKLVAEKGELLKGRVAIVPLSIDEQPEQVTRHISQRGWTHLGHYWAGSTPAAGWDARPARAYVVSGVPTTFLISRDGRILWRGDPLARLGGKDLETRLEEAAKDQLKGVTE